MTRLYVRHDSLTCMTWISHICDMNESYVWYDSFICVCRERRMHPWEAQIPVIHDSFICETWLVHMWDMTHLHEWHESVMSVIRLIHMCVATISRLLKMTGVFCKKALEKRPYSAKETYHFKELTNRSHPICVCRDRGMHPWEAQIPVIHDSFICETWLIHMYDIDHFYACHDSFKCETWLIHTYDMDQIYVWYASFICMCWGQGMHTFGKLKVLKHDSFICETWLVHMWDMTQPHVRYDMYHFYAWHDFMHTFEKLQVLLWGGYD